MTEPGQPDYVAERMVVGAILRDPSVLREVQHECVPSDFADQRLGAIYGGVVRMVADRMPVDYLTVFDQFPAWDVRGIDLQDLAAWVDGVPSAAGAAYYGAMVAKAAVVRELRAIGTRLLHAEESGPALVQGLEDLRLLRDRGSAATPLRMLGEVLDVDPKADDYDWVVPGLLERLDRLILTGSEGGGKSTFLRQLAVLAAAGVHPFSNAPVPPVRVLVVDAENSERQWRRTTRTMVDRAAARGGADPRDTLALECVRQMNITRPADLGRIHRRMDEARPDLVLIGPLYRLVGGKAINSDDDAFPVLQALDSIRDRDVTLMVEAHSGHATSKEGDRDLRPRGSSALLGWPEFGLGIAKPEKKGDPFKLRRWRGDRDSRHWPTDLTSQKHFGDQLWPWEPAAGYWRAVDEDAPPLY